MINIGDRVRFTEKFLSGVYPGSGHLNKLDVYLKSRPIVSGMYNGYYNLEGFAGTWEPDSIELDVCVDYFEEELFHV